jgi:AraC family transcriptional regulator
MSGRVYFWDDRVLYVGPGLAATFHAHHAVQVCLPFSGRIRLRSSPRARWGSYAGAVIPSDVPHESDTPVAWLVTLWLDAETAQARRLVEPGERAIRAVQPSKLRAIVGRLAACSEDLDNGRLPTTVLDEVVRTLAPRERRSGPFDIRVERDRELLHSAPMRRLKLSDLAPPAVALSPSRLAHLFSAQLGLPIRRYLLWLRLRDAVREVARGATTTEAAHAAGFADAPHFDRTFRRMLGFTPSALRSASTFVQDGLSIAD